LQVWSPLLKHWVWPGAQAPWQEPSAQVIPWFVQSLALSGTKPVPSALQSRETFRSQVG